MKVTSDQIDKISELLAKNINDMAEDTWNDHEMLYIQYPSNLDDLVVEILSIIGIKDIE